MVIFRLLWTVLVNFIAIGVFLGMLSVATTPFETIVVSGMALIYSLVLAFWISVFRLQISGLIALSNQLIFLARMHDASNKRDELARFEEDAITLTDEFQNQKVIYAINAFFIFFFWFIALGAIILALLS